jgi:hypothetical protein
MANTHSNFFVKMLLTGIPVAVVPYWSAPADS